MINLIIRKVLNDYVAFINDFKYHFSPNWEEFESRSGINRSGISLKVLSMEDKRVYFYQ